MARRRGFSRWLLLPGRAQEAGGEGGLLERAPAPRGHDADHKARRGLQGDTWSFQGDTWSFQGDAWTFQGDAEAAPTLAQRAAELLVGLGPLQLPARQVDDGQPGGLHRSSKRGGGVEFSEHKEYSPGDALQHIDWKAWARTDRYYVKRYEQDVHAALTLCVDASASMKFGDVAGGDKWDAVKLVLAALALVLVRQGDAVALCVIGRPDQNLGGGTSLRHFAQLAERLDKLEPAGASGVDVLGPGSWRGLDRRGLCVVASDVLVEPDLAVAPLDDLRRAGLDVLLLHTLHPREIDLEFGAPVWLHCPETGERRLTDPRIARHTFQRLMAEHCDQLRVACGHRGLGYLQVDTSVDPRRVIRRVLRATARLVQRRRAGAVVGPAFGDPTRAADALFFAEPG